VLSFTAHFFIGLLGSLLIFWLFYRLSGAQSTSAPFGLVLLGIACGTLAVQVSPWLTPAILALYAAASANELRVERRLRRERDVEKSGEK